MSLTGACFRGLASAGVLAIVAVGCTASPPASPTEAPAATSAPATLTLTDNLPLQFKSASGGVVMTFSDWNSPISIEPPM